MKQRVFDGMEYVYAVYREGSFQKAAEKLFVSQPSVSASVRRAEERVGSRLFDRSRKPLALTECGEAYIACTEKIFAMERDFTEYVNDWVGLRRGRLAVGGSSLFSSLLLPPMMASFRERYPGICYYRLPEPESRRDIRLFWKRGRYKTRAMEAFLAMPPENGGEG